MSFHKPYFNCKRGGTNRNFELAKSTIWKQLETRVEGQLVRTLRCFAKELVAVKSGKRGECYAAKRDA
jgi:hypothetical protein